MPTCFYNALRIFGGVMGVMGLIIICIQTLSECRDKQFCRRDRVPFEGIGLVILGVIAFVSSFVLLWCRGKKEHELQVEDKIEPKVHYTRASPGYNTESARQSADATPCNTPTSAEGRTLLDTKVLCEKLDCVAMERECRVNEFEGHYTSSEVDHPHLSLNTFQQHLSRLTPSPHRPDNMDSLRKIQQDYSVVDETVRRPSRTPSVLSNVSKTFKKPGGSVNSSRRSSLTGSQRYGGPLVPYSGSSESLYSEEEECDDRTALLTRGSSRSLLVADDYTEESSRRGYFFFPTAREARRDTWGNRGTFKKTRAFHNRWEQSEPSPQPQLVQLYSSAEDIHCVQTTRYDQNHHGAHTGSTPNNWLSQNPNYTTCTSFEQVQSACEYETPLSRAREQTCACEDCRISKTTVVKYDGYSSDEERSEYGDSESEMRLSSPRSTIERPKTPFVGRKPGWFISSDEEYVPSGKSASDHDSASNRHTNSSAAEDFRTGRWKMMSTKLTDLGHRNVDEVSSRSRSNSMGTSMISRTPQTEKHIDQDATFASQRKRSQSLHSKQIQRDSTAAKAKQARSRLRPGSPVNRLVRQNSMRVPSAEERSNSESMLNVRQDSRYLSVPGPVYPTKGKKSSPNPDRRSQRTKDAKPQPKSLDSTASRLRPKAGRLGSNRSLYSSCPDLGCSSLSIHNLAEAARDRLGKDGGNDEALSKFDRHVDDWCARYLSENGTKEKQQVPTDQANKKTDPQVNKRPPKDVEDGNARRTNDKVDHRHNERHPTKQPAQSKPVEHNRGLDADKQKNSERSTRTSTPDSPSPRHKLKQSNSHHTPHHRNAGHGHTLKVNSSQGEQSGGSNQKLYEHNRGLDLDKQKNSERSTRTSTPDSPSPRHKLKQSNSHHTPHHRNAGHGHTLKVNSSQGEQSGGSNQKLYEHNRGLDLDKQKNSERSTRTSTPDSPFQRHKRSNSHHRNSGHGHTLKVNSSQREQSGGSTQKLYEHKRTGDQIDGRRSHRTHVHDKVNTGRPMRGSKKGHNHSDSKDKPRNKGGNSYDGDVDTPNDHGELLPKPNAGKHVHVDPSSKLRERAHHIKDRIDTTAHQMVDRHKERAHHIKDRIDTSAQHMADRHRERRHHIKDRLNSKRERAQTLVGRPKERARQLKDRVKGHSDSPKGRHNRSNSQPSNSSHSNKQTRNIVRRNTTGTTPSLLSTKPGGRGGSGTTLMSRLAPSPLTILTASSSSLQLLQRTLAS